ncbi:hypothetical protein HUO13_34840 [Saccharopolyspora erythraea]|uniref:hypothetical protein n=1 Tax=Saccharopolyspora erythraea TaxID=1836 RepID=UPI001BA6FE91|nr:hypothetical protein [Saccharopolyspora erythraea]QUH05267.1 hypothetical protein HUO13_34840 [Saccharopolyspora erythraea]
MSRKALIGVTAAWGIVVGIAAAVFLAIAVFGGTKLDETSATPGSSKVVEQYRWDGKPILVTSARSGGGVARCQVTPDSGEPREISTRGAEGRYEVRETTAWFSGSATLVCRDRAVVRTGSQITMYELATKNRIAQIAAVVVGAGPFLAVSVFGLGRRKVDA